MSAPSYTDLFLPNYMILRVNFPFQKGSNIFCRLTDIKLK